MEFGNIHTNTHITLSDSHWLSFLLPIDDYKAGVSEFKQFKQHARTHITTQYPVIDPLSAPDTSKTGKTFQQAHRCGGVFGGGARTQL